MDDVVAVVAAGLVAAGSAAAGERAGVCHKRVRVPEPYAAQQVGTVKQIRLTARTPGLAFTLTPGNEREVKRYGGAFYGGIDFARLGVSGRATQDGSIQLTYVPSANNDEPRIKGVVKVKTGDSARDVLQNIKRSAGPAYLDWSGFSVTDWNNPAAERSMGLRRGMVWTLPEQGNTAGAPVDTL